MTTFIPNKNVKNDVSFGEIVNQIVKDFIRSELKKRKITQWSNALIEIFDDGKTKIALDDEVKMIMEFKKPKVKQNDVGRPITVNLKEIKNLTWDKTNVDKKSAKILILHFNKNWWVLNTDFRNNKTLKEKYKVKRTFKVRGGGYLPLDIRRKEKDIILKQWQDNFKAELPKMWKRHITVKQKYYGAMVYDGNYYDLFLNAQNLYVLGYYYESIIICRTATEQALVAILTKEGKGFEIYKNNKRKKSQLKGIEALVNTCRSYSLFGSRYPINKTAERKLKEIAEIANELVHPRHELKELDEYKEKATKCMDNLDYVIKKHLNFIKDTGVVRGYRFVGEAKRLK